MAINSQKSEIEKKKQERARIKEHLKKMHLVSKSSMGNTLFYIGLDKESDLYKKKMNFEEQIELTERDFTNGNFWQLKGCYNTRGYYWNHYGPSAEQFFFNAYLVENNKPEIIKFYFDEQYKELDSFLKSFEDVFQSDFDFPVGGVDIIIDEIISLKITSDKDFSESIRRLVNFATSDLFNHNGIS